METITIKDIAKLCGVAVSTVSRAINNHPDINEETKAMIMKVIKENNYIPNNSARNLKRLDSNTIAVLIKGITNPLFSNIIKTFELEIKKKKYSFILHRVEDREDEVDVAIQLEKEKRLKGIVFLGGHFFHSDEKLAQLNVPFVLSTIGSTQKIDKNICSSVSVDDFKESYKLVDYLCSLGHKKIAIITASMDDESIGNLRLNGYMKALKDNNIEIDEKLIRYMKDGIETYSMENGYMVTQELLESQQEFTAIYAISDTLAIGACKAIFDAGKKIPEDYSVAGFDGLDIAKYYNPSITTIRQPVEKMAQSTIKILFDMIRKKTPAQHVLFQGELVPGKSTKSI
ncbi:LacI family DNA-binding transcriptional regulator [Clostridium sp. 19966]|uniref:LacI family DNA-binding transcriptional regulator n=1 Tax=Clostridium sp. 19966 TaxID=2768166 RepID=UPI0028DE324A|nr:LacI family DNA-binding transcriptional regulator [Clostridium sp. 19966]MDT8719422.1 LacI family DNA-binding transcriptional regulator [Clostridium sp. 19966]